MRPGRAIQNGVGQGGIAGGAEDDDVLGPLDSVAAGR